MSFPGAAVVAGPGGTVARGATLGAEVWGAAVGAAGLSDAGADSVFCDAGTGDVPVSVIGAVSPPRVGAAGAWTVGAINTGSAGAWIGTEA
jgi:hypothetical protein